MHSFIKVFGTEPDCIRRIIPGSLTVGPTLIEIMCSVVRILRIAPAVAGEQVDADLCVYSRWLECGTAPVSSMPLQM